MRENGGKVLMTYQHVGYALEALLVLVDLVEVLAELDEGHGGELPGGVHDERAVGEGVEVGLHDEEIGAALDGQEARARHVDALGLLEVLHRSTGGALELDDAGTVDGLLVLDDVHVLEDLAVDEALDGVEADPQVVGVEDLELLDGLELVDLVLRHLGDLEQLGLALVVDERTTLDVGPGLVGHLHDELVVGLHHVLQNVCTRTR